MADDLKPSDTPNESGTPPPVATSTAHRVVVFDRIDGAIFCAVTLLSLTVYLVTLAPNVTLEFSGILSTGAMYVGVPHPPGYPVWTLYSWLWTQVLPFSNIAWRVAVGSAMASALSCGLIAMTVSWAGLVLFGNTPTLAHLKSSELQWLRCGCGSVAGLGFAFNRIVWEKAVIAEIGALSLLLFVSLLCLLMRWMCEPARRQLLYAGFFVFGLLLTNSQELLVTAPGLVCAVMLANRNLGRDLALFTLPIVALGTAMNQSSLWIAFPEQHNWPLIAPVSMVCAVGVVLAGTTRRLGTEWKAALTCGFCLLLGLAFYFCAPMASMTNPPVNWGYPRTVEGFVHVISRAQYTKMKPSPFCEPGRYLEQLWAYLLQTGKGFGWPCLIFSLVPFCFFFRVTPLGRRILFGLLGIFFCVAPLLLIELNPPLDRRAQEIIEQYFAASYAVLAVWFGFGLILVGAKLTARRERMGNQVGGAS